MKFLILDGSSLIYRAFYALPTLTTSTGEFTNAIFGFSSMLINLLKDHQPDLICNCLDASRKTFRTDLFHEYKAHRDKTPDELLSQIQPIIDLCSFLGIKTIVKENYEADDLIGTLATQSAAENIDTVIVTGDRDSLQLLQKNIRVFFTRKGTQNLKIYDESTFFDEYQLKPKQLIDLKALQGDKSDNIPGIPLIGQKTATQLLIDYHTLENVLEHVDDIKQQRTRENLTKFKDQAILCKKLATIDCNVPDIKFEADNFTMQVNLDAVKDFCQHYELNKHLQKFNSLFNKEIELNIFDDDLTESVDYVQDENVTYVRDLKQLLHKNQSMDLKNVVDLGVANYLIYPDESSRLKKIPDHLNSERMLKIGRELYSKLESENLLQLYKTIELPLIPVLYKMEKTGVFVDKSAIESKSKEIGIQLDNLMQDIFSIAGEKFNINSPKQLSDILFEKLKLPPTKKNKRGYSTDIEALENLQHPIVKKILEYRMLTKMKSTYLDGILALIDSKTNRVHTKFHQTIVATGRLSSSDPNLQNVPIRTEIGKSIRRLFIPGEGFESILSADYSQIELRILAHMSNDDNFIKAFISNEDIHSRTAAEVFNVPIESVTSDQRRKAKAVNFGIVYGISDFGLSKDLHISRKEAADYITRFYERYPAVKMFLNQTIALAREYGFTKTLFGRKRNLPSISSPNFYTRSLTERMAMNSPIQGTAADIIKLAMINVDKQLQEKNLQSRIILQVHDELVLEVINSEIDEVKKILKQEMENVTDLKVPLVIDIHIGKNWAEAK